MFLNFSLEILKRRNKERKGWRKGVGRKRKRKEGERKEEREKRIEFYAN